MRKKSASAEATPASSSTVHDRRNAAANGDSEHEKVASLAYSYWEARGFQGGSPEEDWLRAEEELRRELAQQSQ
jgi:hypothetical protein